MMKAHGIKDIFDHAQFVVHFDGCQSRSHDFVQQHPMLTPFHGRKLIITLVSP
jgi:hypothetical protein